MSDYSNEPAFPELDKSYMPAKDCVGHEQIDHISTGGLTRLEWFAGMALQSLLSHEHLPGNQVIARDAFDIAEAMCTEAERRRKQ